jgi:hypothetical protein
MQAEADLDRDRIVSRLAAAAPPCTSISKLMGVDHSTSFDGNNSPTQDLTGPIVRVDHQGCHGHDGGVVLIEFRGNRT